MPAVSAAPARDALEIVLARCDARAAAETVFTAIYRDAARAAADASDARRRTGTLVGPLDGRIVSVKDLFDVAGETTLAGSRILRGAPPAQQDAVIVARLRRAGAVILGKTNMTEFAFSGIGINPHYGTPGNAADPALVPGGSSAGAGVSVAEGTSEIAIGSDTGGSIRIPASLNGVVGFKPTTGRVPTQGAFPLSYTLDSVGPLARTVADCALADAVMAGEEPRPLVALPLAGLRIGVPRGRLFAQTEDIVTEGFEQSLRHLAQEGARIVDIDIEDLLEAFATAMAKAPLVAIEAASVHAERIATQPDGFHAPVLARIRMGAGVAAADYITLLRRREELIAAMDERLASLDLVALPATATTAPSIAALEADFDAFMAANALMLRNTTWGNLFDLTGISLPMPGMVRPAGLMLMSRRGHDMRLLRLAAGIEGVLR